MKTSCTLLLVCFFCLGNSLPVQRVAPFFVSNPVSASGGGGANTLIISGAGTARNDFTGVVGCKFTANANVTVTDLGRLVWAGNANAHTVYLTDSTGATVLASASVTTAGIGAGTYNYTALGAGVSLTAGTSYYLVSTETSGGDSWGNDDATITSSSDFTVVNSAHAGSAPPVVFTDDTAAHCFVNPNFKYTKP